MPTGTGLMLKSNLLVKGASLNVGIESVPKLGGQFCPPTNFVTPLAWVRGEEVGHCGDRCTDASSNLGGHFSSHHLTFIFRTCLLFLKSLQCFPFGISKPPPKKTVVFSGLHLHVSELSRLHSLNSDQLLI